MRRDRNFLIIGAVFMTIIAIASIFPSLLAPHEQNAIVDAPLLPPSGQYWLGTDEIGRDIWSRVIFGARSELFISLVAALVSTVLGTLAGLYFGLRGGTADTVGMRAVDVLLAFPTLVLVLFVVAIFGRDLLVMTIALILVIAPGMVRLARGVGLVLSKRSYVAAAKISGAGNWYLIRRHLLPNAMPTVILAASITASGALVTAASLSYLGLGVRPPAASWGNMLRASYDVVYIAPYYGVVPGLLLALVALSYTWIGRGLNALLTGVSSKDSARSVAVSAS